MRTYSLIGLALATTLSISCGSSEPPPSEPAAEAVEQPKEPVEQPKEPVEPQPVEPPPKPEVAELPPLDNTCKSDDDCIPAPSCCSIPCTSNVINRSALPEAKKRLEGICPQPSQCVSAGGCRTHAYLCVEGTCALVYEGDEHYRKRRGQ